jgi:hypothetical protein
VGAFPLTRRGALVAGISLLLLASGGRRARAIADGGPVIDPEVRTAVGRGPARVLVELRMPEPAPGAAPAREAAIAAARHAVLARLSGTTYRLVRDYTSVPLLALEIGPDALQALEAMGDLVARVRAEALRRPIAPR